MASNDPEFEIKAANVIGPYLNPHAHTAEFGVDEKMAIQALDRNNRMLPLSPGRAESHGFEYKRNGTLSLFAALNTATGEVLGKTAPRHTSAQFVDSLTSAVLGTPAVTRNPATGEALAEVTQGTEADVAAAVAAARRAQPRWAALGGHGRARVLYALGRLVQKHSRLFAVLETLDNGKPIRESRDIDVPLVARHFGYHAGLAQLMEAELPGHVAQGVCAAVIPWIWKPAGAFANIAK